jgi:predicted transcriptional regulator of viral defense system
MSRAVDQALAAIGTRHHGVFTIWHARMVRMSEAQIDHRIASGQWTVIHPGVYRIAGTPTSWKGSLLAACWAGGFRAAASHRSAAALHGLAGGRRSMPEITCPRWRRARHDLVVHESKAIDVIDLTVVEGIPVTTPERTLLDLGAVCSESVVHMALDAAESRELVTLDSVGSALRRLGRPGRNGAGVLRRLVSAKLLGQRPSESEMETLLIRALRRWGFPDPVPQYEIRSNGCFVARVDAAIPKWRVAIEYDSALYHAGRSAHERDSARRNRILAAGFVPVTATAKDLRGDGRELRSAIRAARRAS